MPNNTIEYNKFQLNQIRKETKILRIYFNNLSGGKAVDNAMQFKDITDIAINRQCSPRRILVRAHTSPEMEASRVLAQDIRGRMLFRIMSEVLLLLHVFLFFSCILLIPE
jgi:hypothetical protein